MKIKVIVRTSIVAGLVAAPVIAYAGMPCTVQGDADQQREEAPVIVTETAAPIRGAVIKVQPQDMPAEVPARQREVISSPSEKDAYLLAKLAMAEAEGEDTEGKALVMLVVRNRVRSNKFPDTVKEVIYQEGQFSPISDGRFNVVEPDADCWDALKLVERGWDRSMGATYFESKSNSTWHRDNLKFLFRHGGHSFYADKEECR